MLFPGTRPAARIERSEARLIRASTEEVIGRRGVSARGFVHPIGGGVAAYADRNLPLNKVAGVGFGGDGSGGAVGEGEWEEIERLYGERACPVQVELSNLADPSIAAMLTRRGYVLVNFENVLGMGLGGGRAPGVAEMATASQLEPATSVLVKSGHGVAEFARARGPSSPNFTSAATSVLVKSGHGVAEFARARGPCSPNFTSAATSVGGSEIAKDAEPATSPPDDGGQAVGGSDLGAEPGTAVRGSEGASDVAVEVCGAAELEAWIDAVITGFEAPDVEGVASHEHFDRAEMERVYRDLAGTNGYVSYLARRDGKPAGGGAVFFGEGVAHLCGAATLPAHRRRGVQSALLARRLRDAAARGCDIAVVVTQPGSKSQENVMKRGFTLLYTRAILVKEAGG